MRVCFKQPKTDPFRQGIGLQPMPGGGAPGLFAILGVPDHCLNFHQASSSLGSGSLKIVREALQQAGVDQQKCCGHGFCIHVGAATTVVAKGMEDSVIETLGHWENVAYLQYVCRPRDQLCDYSHVHSPHLYVCTG